MRLTRIDAPEPFRRGRLDTNTVARFDEVATFAEMLPVLDELRAFHAPARILCTLDDVEQCAYTRGHASMDDALWLDQGEVDDEDADARRAAGDRAVTHIATQLDDPALRADWVSLPAARFSGEPDVVALLELNRDPDLALDDVVLAQRVPVARDDLAIAGIPNGYFTADWNTFQNHAIVRRLAEHGYRHFGVGASTLGFDRPMPPSAGEADAVVADLAHLYGTPGAPAWAELAALLPERCLLILGYTENFAEMLD